MRVRPLMLMLAGSLVLAPLAVLAQDRAVPRGGGDGGGSRGGGSSAHPGVQSSGGGSSSGSGYSGGSSSGSSSGGSYSPSTAERRHPRAGTGRGSSGGYPGYPGYPGYYPPYYPGWGGYYSYWWPYASYGWYGGYWGSPWGYGYGGYGGTVYHRVEGEAGAVRVLVEPSEARVYVDGYYAGTVDDFDGLFQRLNVSPGRHEIAIKLEGYRTHRFKVYVPPDGTVKIHHDMVRGDGETLEDLAGEAPREREASREPEGRWEREDPDPAPQDERAGTGRLRLRVDPPDASVYVDGAFRGTGREAANLRLPAGPHRIEVVRPGYRTVERDVEITAGETSELEIDLDKGGSI